MSAIALSSKQWADRIRGRLASTIEAIIEVGVDLEMAKSQLGGRFVAMVERDLGMSASTAQRFMAIARHEVLANTAHGQHLPPSWRTLYELSRVDPVLLEQAIADHVVTPEMERSAAEELVARYKPRRATITTTSTETVTVDTETGEVLGGDDREAPEVAAGASAPPVQRGTGPEGGTSAPVPESDAAGASTREGEGGRDQGLPSCPPDESDTCRAAADPRQELRDAWHAEITRATSRLITFDPDELADVLAIDDARGAAAAVREVGGWCERVEAALSQPNRTLKAV